jgi:hypothetical protein
LLRGFSLNVLKTDLKKESFVNKILPHLVEINADLSAIIANIGSSDLTKQLAEKDDARDRAFVGFREYCNAFIHMPDPVKSAAAEKLTRLIRKVASESGLLRTDRFSESAERSARKT